MNQQLVYTPLAEPFVMGVMSVVAVILSVFSSNLLFLSRIFICNFNRCYACIYT